jgi:hypothetical protein
MSRRHAPVWIAIILLLALGSPPALASSHSEAPGTSKDRLADDTDLYAWIASDAPGAVTIVGNWAQLIEPPAPQPPALTTRRLLHQRGNGAMKKHVRFEFTFHTTRQNDNTFPQHRPVKLDRLQPNAPSSTLTHIDVDSGRRRCSARAGRAVLVRPPRCRTTTR